MTTNAAKYGALSSPAGRLRVHWSISGDDINLEWNEDSGSAIAKPDKNGFGTKIIVSSIESQLGGRVKHDWRPDGVSCVISIPLARTFEAAQQSGPPPAKANGSTKPHPHIGAAKTIMVVEDEALVALSLHDFLSELGYSVVGPVGRVTEALRILNQRPVDAAILDVNLAGEFVYPLAELLRDAEISRSCSRPDTVRKASIRASEISQCCRSRSTARHSRPASRGASNLRSATHGQPKRTIQAAPPIDGRSHSGRLVAPPPQLKRDPRGAMRE